MILLSIALAQGLIRAGVVAWLAYLIVAVLYLLIAGVLVFVGKKTIAEAGAAGADDPHQQGHRGLPQEPAVVGDLHQPVSAMSDPVGSPDAHPTES